MRVAAIDCGTNSIRLLIADVDADGGLHDLVRRMEIVRLGYGVDRTGVLDPERMAATLAIVPRSALIFPWCLIDTLPLRTAAEQFRSTHPDVEISAIVRG